MLFLSPWRNGRVKKKILASLLSMYNCGNIRKDCISCSLQWTPKLASHQELGTSARYYIFDSWPLDINFNIVE